MTWPAGSGWRIWLLLSIATAASLLGCALATDFINPDVLSALGIEPLALLPPPARVMLVYNNETDFEASFLVTVSDDTADPTSNARSINATLQPNEVIANVLECPLGVITPGTASADFTTGTVAVQVTAAAGTGVEANDVTYNGAPLVFGDDFQCGDVIEIRAIQFQAEQQAAGDTQTQAAFGIRVRVIPGR